VALNPKRTASAASAAVDAWKTQLNSGKLRIYSGTQPANASTAIAGNTLLAELTFNATAFGASSNGVATANAISDVSAAATGTATWFRALKSGGVDVTDNVYDGTVGTATCDLIINSTAIQSGATVHVATSPTLTETM
jgi:hypothetical protein